MFGLTWRSKVAVVFALLASPLAMFVGFHEQARIGRIMEQGQDYQAVIDQVQRHRSRRGNYSYDVWFNWTDGYGVVHRDYLSVTDTFGESAAAGQPITVRVAPGEREIVIVQDAEGKTRESWWMVAAGVVIGVFGVCFAPSAFRREQRSAAALA